MELRNAGGRGEEERIRDERRGEESMKMCVVVVEKEEEENHDESSPPVVGVVLFQPCPVQLKSIVESGPGAKQSAEEAGPGPAPEPAPGYQDPPCLADQGGLVPPMSTHVDPCRCS
ncbi:hypothetical protein IFR04_008655 [Cadophora malorum]|uniref:Uncharacterized protein n=1 Tax=Cadophora malorum TaxID=108018 RepID=A0A8H7W9V5_9HELO|nr:hypothetical protein IFR04_008655 [Cadophora malorum]